MKLIPVKTPWLFRKIFPNYVWNVKTDEKIIYLTFDDGPTPEVTDFVLDTLNAHQAKATFFCIGNNVEKHPKLFQRILAEGHRVGNHTQNHTKGWETTTAAYLQDVAAAEGIIQDSKFKVQGLGFEVQDSGFNTEISRQNSKAKNTSKVSLEDLGDNQQSSIDNLQSSIPKLFRPPYGLIKPAQSKQLMQLAYKIVMWDVISFDWEQELSEEKCLQNVISNTESGSIIVFHDSIKASKNMMYALPRMLAYFSEKGFRFESLK
ncbi:polysaccharide deacetylase family protein [Subsaximicrobium wynnwilliamsii]|uniref:Polysaccharide deacetylase family protein n=1 Tax=Subsaximicrobium wynnwilliamsii TaxID=291179 RepID=A0A5C6ZDI2_9FLAO|nr:polysaccharide deacetylase family protein [Subsaximicrobium wynnwilliamsii]TXD82416.1 polysaccharide deacetylase family protein [Subsaximicrobium wynnwilliamsii]TXD88058.1 polysaccharide deacetylase family protein [Subsaximicrobium wynnwilliamsii]TXE02080.1 polysaccharide deacetylase family protein [Subsaximicrobium wynnwilliamsii]